MAPIFKSIAAMTAMLSTLTSAVAIPTKRQAPPGIVLQTVTQTATSWERIDVTVTITVGGATVTPEIPANTTPTVNTVSQVAVDGTFYTVITTSTTINLQTTYALPGGTGAPAAPVVTAAPPTQPAAAPPVTNSPPQSTGTPQSSGGQFFQNPSPDSSSSSSSTVENIPSAPASSPPTTPSTSSSPPSGGSSGSGGYGTSFAGATYPRQALQSQGIDTCPHGSDLGVPGTKAPGGKTSGPCDSEANFCTGDMTHYDVATSMANPSSCGNANNGASDDVVALSHLLMPNKEFCGKKINLFNPVTGKSGTATVVDTCEGCDIPTSIDMSNHLYETLMGPTDTTTSCGRSGGISWYFA